MTSLARDCKYGWWSITADINCSSPREALLLFALLVHCCSPRLGVSPSCRPLVFICKAKKSVLGARVRSRSRRCLIACLSGLGGRRIDVPCGWTMDRSPVLTLPWFINYLWIYSQSILARSFGPAERLPDMVHAGCNQEMPSVPLSVCPRHLACRLVCHLFLGLKPHALQVLLLLHAPSSLNGAQGPSTFEGLDTIGLCYASASIGGLPSGPEPTRLEIF